MKAIFISKIKIAKAPVANPHQRHKLSFRLCLSSSQYPLGQRKLREDSSWYQRMRSFPLRGEVKRELILCWIQKQDYLSGIQSELSKCSSILSLRRMLVCLQHKTLRHAIAIRRRKTSFPEANLARMKVSKSGAARMKV